MPSKFERNLNLNFLLCNYFLMDFDYIVSKISKNNSLIENLTNSQTPPCNKLLDFLKPLLPLKALRNK